jgi:hypothetical protein
MKAHMKLKAFPLRPKKLQHEKSGKKSLKAPFAFSSAFKRRIARKNQKGGELKLLSRDCDGCSQMKACSRRYFVVEKGDKVYCPDGTAHLVDGL